MNRLQRVIKVFDKKKLIIPALPFSTPPDPALPYLTCHSVPLRSRQVLSPPALPFQSVPLRSFTLLTKPALPHAPFLSVTLLSIPHKTCNTSPIRSTPFQSHPYPTGTTVPLRSRPLHTTPATPKQKIMPGRIPGLMQVSALPSLLP